MNGGRYGMLVMHELKQIMISVLKSLIVAPLPVEYKEVL
jgi:hypothetical protein